MRVMIDLCIVPIGVGTSLSKYIIVCEKILQETELEIQLHAYGTNIAGPWDEVFAAVKRCHEALHELGAPRITTTIKCGTRTDKTQTIQQKINSVADHL